MGKWAPWKRIASLTMTTVAVAASATITAVAGNGTTTEVIPIHGVYYQTAGAAGLEYRKTPSGGYSFVDSETSQYFVEIESDHVADIVGADGLVKQDMDRVHLTLEGVGVGDDLAGPTQLIGLKARHAGVGYDPAQIV